MSLPVASHLAKVDSFISRRAATTAHASIVLLGAGAIGRELLDQITRPGTGLATSLRVCGIIDRSGFVFDALGLSRQQLAALSLHKARGDSFASAPDGRTATAIDAVEIMSACALPRVILVDATAAPTSAVLERALAHGWDLVLANKIPLADRSTAARLEQISQRYGRRVLCEATVGAGLPVIDTLRKLMESGDEVTSIEGCPSGTLGYLFGELGSGRSFATAVRSAVAAGYTEPDPRIDLSGIDVARKAFILARIIGFDGELSGVDVESLVPQSLYDVSRDDFIARLDEFDEYWREMVQAARANGTVLRYRARVTPSSVNVGLVAVAVTDSLGVLNGTDNQFSFSTARYKHQPLVITGPGAGSAVTAAGILNDILRLAAERGVEHAVHRRNATADTVSTDLDDATSDAAGLG